MENPCTTCVVCPGQEDRVTGSVPRRYFLAIAWISKQSMYCEAVLHSRSAVIRVA